MYCISYVIKKGDTLYKISRQFNVGITEIMNANPMINLYNLMVDEAICIPVNVPENNNQTNVTSYTVVEGDTLENIMQNNDVELGELLSLNDLKDIHLLPGSTLKLPVALED